MKTFRFHRRRPPSASSASARTGRNAPGGGWAACRGRACLVSGAFGGRGSNWGSGGRRWWGGNLKGWWGVGVAGWVAKFASLASGRASVGDVDPGCGARRAEDVEDHHVLERLG